MRHQTQTMPRSRWLQDERGIIVEYEIVEPTSGSAWEGRLGRRPRPQLRGDSAKHIGGPRPTAESATLHRELDVRTT